VVYTLGQAATATGKSKTTIANAIKKGRISARKDETGAYTIDPAELHRVYAPLPVHRTPKVDDARPQLDPELERLKAALEGVSRERDLLADSLVEARLDRDEWRGQAKALQQKLLPAPRPERGWWPFGKLRAGGPEGDG
jgi:hypothetical protein